MSGFYEEKKAMDTMSNEQREAAMVFDTPVLIVAGAGSGKTKTLIGRATKLLLPKEHGGLEADPGSLMMVTFTNKAGREMRERFSGVLGALRENGVFGEPWIGTFHSISMRILRIEAKHAGYGANFTIMDDSDARDVAKEAASELGLDTFDIDEFFSNLEYAKARLLTPDLILRKKAEIQTAIEQNVKLSPPLERWNDAIHKRLSPDFPAIYKAYQDTLSKNNAVDFSDLINQVTLLFRKRPDIRDSWRSTFRHFMVDESQDMNPAQAAWLAEITGRGAETIIEHTTDTSLSFDDATAGGHVINNHRLRSFPRPSIVFVGDDDQSIYAFRGSDSGIMMGLGRSYQDLQVKYLTQSYRCQPNVLSAANRLIANNEMRFDKEVVAADAARTGVSVVIKEFKDHKEEFKRLGDEVEQHIQAGGKPSDFGILLRTRNAVRDIAKYLRERGLPVTEGKASDIRKSAEVRDVMAYAGFLVNPDAEIYLRRIINKPSRGMGMSSITRVSANAKMKNIPFTDELRSVINKRIELPDGGQAYPTAFVRSAQQFGHLIVTMRDKISAVSASQALAIILKDSGYLNGLYDDVLSATGLSKKNEAASLRAMAPREFMREVMAIKGDKTDNDVGMEDLADAAGQMSDSMRRVANIALLLEQAENSPSLRDFVQDATLEMSETKDAPGVNVMTVHASKGLEFDHVRLPLWYNGMMPLDDTPEELAEERRLAYVAITRARHSVNITFPREVGAARFVMGKAGKVKPSPFLDEIISRTPDVVFFNAWGKRKGPNERVAALPGTEIAFAQEAAAYNPNGGWRRNQDTPAKKPDFVWKKEEATAPVISSEPQSAFDDFLRP